MIRKAIILIAPLLLLASIELAFRLGLWEPMAASASHAGTSIQLKRDLLDPGMAKIDFVTLGSSRPEYGIDHERVAVAARQHGFVHANLSMPGVHWMSIGMLTNWLRQHHPEIRGGIIALSAQDLSWPGNGYYEVGIVQPFRQASDNGWVEAHVPFVQSMDACDRLDADVEAPANLGRQCREISGIVKDRPDYSAWARQSPLPETMQRTRDLVQRQLRGITWPTPPIVVLMPTPPIWRNDAHGAGLQQWALTVLNPLDDDGTIRLIDATTFFDADKDGGCSDFGDFYHQNSKGRRAFSDWLLPQIDQLLYQPATVD